jgi:hypothetical protein
MTATQLILNICIFAANGAAVFAMAWLIDRWLFAVGDIIKATLIASTIGTGLWFVALWAFGDGINPFGTALMGGTGAALAMMAAVIGHRRRIEKLTQRRRKDAADTFT